MGFKQPKVVEDLRRYGPSASANIGKLEEMAALANSRQPKSEKEMIGRNIMAAAGMSQEQAGTSDLSKELKELGDQYKRESRGTVPAAEKEEKLKKGGSVSSASRRADGIAQRGKTKGRMV
jgi:hypothetical protein